jgi:hypothetical protein
MARLKIIFERKNKEEEIKKNDERKAKSLSWIFLYMYSSSIIVIDIVNNNNIFKVGDYKI